MRLGLEQKRTEINTKYAQSLGESFRAYRENLKLDAQEVADKLLLSTEQVHGLESGEPDKFYGSKLFAQAADKYAAFIKLGSKPSVELLQTDKETDDAETSSTSTIAEPALTQSIPKEPNTTAESRPRTMRLVGIAALFSTVFGVIAAQFLGNKSVDYQKQTNDRDRDTSIAVTATPGIIGTPVNLENTSKETVTVSRQQNDSKDIKAGHIRIEFNGTSWVQSVQANGTKHEKMYHKGEMLDLQPAELQALLIGNVTAVDVYSASSEINLKPYVASGSQVAKVIGPSIRNLAN